MCGRFGLAADHSFAAQEYNAKVAYKFEKSYNVSPGQQIPAVINDNGLVIESFRWGFLPSWAKDDQMAMINARGETISEKPMFKNAFTGSRCLILATGFYEWKKTEEGKIPYYIHLKNRDLFSFAGLWSEWNNMKTCTIITITPNSLLNPIHDRMPVILEKSTENDWLNNNDTNVLHSFLKPYQASEMEAYPVSKKVNKPEYDFSDCTKRIIPKKGNLSSFF